jgi:hypothetical protein
VKRLLHQRWWIILTAAVLVLGMDIFGSRLFFTGVAVAAALTVLLIIVVLVGRLSREQEWRTMGGEGLRQAAAAELERRLQRKRAATAVDFEQAKAAERARRQ